MEPNLLTQAQPPVGQHEAGQPPKTKEQLIKELEIKKETDRKRTLAKEVIYPFLLKSTKSIHDAQVMCEVMANAIQTKFSNTVMEYQKNLSKDSIANLGLEKEISQAPEFARDRELMALLSGETVAASVELISGMGKAIEGFIKEESNGRPLETLKTHFL